MSYGVIVWKTYKRTHQLKSGIWKRSNSLTAPSMKGNFNLPDTFLCVLSARLSMSPHTLSVGNVHCARHVVRFSKPLAFESGFQKQLDRGARLSRDASAAQQKVFDGGGWGGRFRLS